MTTYWPLTIDHRNPVGGVVADLRARCDDDMQLFLRGHFSLVLTFPPDKIQSCIRIAELIASIREKEAKGVHAGIGAHLTYTWASPPAPRRFCWGGAQEDGELAAIGRVLDEKKACIGAARRYADAVGASFVPYYLAVFRTLLATSLVELTAVESASCVAAISAGDHYDPHRQFVLEAPSRDANGVPLLSRSEIDRVVPAAFGVAWAWAALPTDGQDRVWQQSCALLVAEALYEARRKQLA